MAFGKNARKLNPEAALSVCNGGLKMPGMSDRKMEQL
jgi:hypothetical protein